MQSKDILNGFTTTGLLDALAARGLDARDLYHRLKELVVYVHDEEQEKDAPWPSEYQEGEASLRAWENAKARAEAEDAKRGDAQVVVGAQVLHAEREPHHHDAVIHTMLCGATCTIDEDGNIEPDDFDFYNYEDRQKATCPACREKA